MTDKSIALGNGNTVGVIPFCLGGGISVATGLIGFGCDNIVSAKIVLADGKVVRADEKSDADIFWAIKGAGQHFALVLELRLKTHSLAIFGTPEGRHWIGNFAFPLDRAPKVCKVMEDLMFDTQNVTAGHLMVMAPPPAFKPMVVVAPHFFGPLDYGPKAFQRLIDLEPASFVETTPLVPNISDHLDPHCQKGDFKGFVLAGLKEFSAERFLEVIEIFERLLKAGPDASASGYIVEWHSRGSKIPRPKTDSAFGHHDVYLWAVSENFVIFS